MTRSKMSSFSRYIGIDYSGAATPSSSLPGLRVYLADRTTLPAEVLPPPSPRKYWTRRGIADWLAERLAEDTPTLVGIDHGFSFPLRYFETHRLPLDWSAFLNDFQRHWPTDRNITVDFVRYGDVGRGADRYGDARWRRLTEIRAGAAKSVFHFDVPGSVAKSTHAGLPWLLALRRQLGDRVHFWPFDGWQVPAGHSAVAEVYPALCKHAFPVDGRTPDQHDAYCGRRMAAPSRSRRQPPGIPRALADVRRTRYRRDRGLDSRRRLTGLAPDLVRRTSQRLRSAAHPRGDPAASALAPSEIQRMRRPTAARKPPSKGYRRLATAVGKTPGSGQPR